MAINIKPDSPNSILISGSNNQIEVKTSNSSANNITISQGETKTVNVTALGPQGSQGIQGTQGVPGNITGSVTNITASGNISASGTIIGSNLSSFGSYW